MSTFRPCIAFPQIPLINSPTPACSTSSRSIRMIPNKLLDTRLVSILCFRVFIDIQSRRPLDSFLGVNPFPCTRFRNSFACHTSENSPVSPAIATDPKTPPNNPCICHTSETPLGSFPSFRTAKGNSQHSIVSGPIHYLLLPIPPIPFFFIFLRTLLRSPKTQPPCFQSFPHSLRKPPGGCGGGRL